MPPFGVPPAPQDNKIESKRIDKDFVLKNIETIIDTIGSNSKYYQRYVNSINLKNIYDDVAKKEIEARDRFTNTKEGPAPMDPKKFEDEHRLNELLSFLNNHINKDILDEILVVVGAQK